MDIEAYSWNARHSDLQHSFKQSVRGVNSVFLSVLPTNRFNYFQIFFHVCILFSHCLQPLKLWCFVVFFLQRFCPSSPELLHLSSMLYLVWRMAALGPALCVMLDEMHLSQLEPLIFMVYCVPPRACTTLGRKAQNITLPFTDTSHYEPVMCDSLVTGSGWSLCVCACN